MTPTEKAKELVDKYSTYVVMWAGGIETSKQNVKQCALIAVDEIISNMPKGFYSGIRPDYKGTDLEYWTEVKQELNKL